MKKTLCILVIVGIVLFVKNRKKFVCAPGEVTIEKGTRFTTMILNVGMISLSRDIISFKNSYH